MRSYFLESKILDAKTGSLVREIVDLDYIVVDNEREALALENNLIKQHKPKFNVMLRDDKTYPYIRYTAFEKFPRVYVTRAEEGRIALFWAVFSAQSGASHRHFIHQNFMVPSCTVDLYARTSAAMFAILHSPLSGALRAGLTTDERYAEAAHDVSVFLEGRRSELTASLRERMAALRRKSDTKRPAGTAICCTS